MLEQYQSYLRLIAEVQTAPRLRGKVDLSGVVQQTIYEGFCQMADKPVESHENIAALLRRILIRNLTDEIRKVTSLKRDVRRERSMESGINTSSDKLKGLLKDHASSPSQKMILFEQVLILADELEQLPALERGVLVARYLRGFTLAEIAATMDKTKPAVAGLLQRGMKRLRTRMVEEE